MKITIISKLFCAFAVCVSLMSLSGAGKKEGHKNNVPFAASLVSVGHSFKVKLSVDRGTDEKLKIILRDKVGTAYYAEMYSSKDEAYRRVFDLTGMSDGAYYFDLYYKNQKLTKEVEIQTNTARTIWFQ
jgi:hypothetical protein